MELNKTAQLQITRSEPDTAILTMSGDWTISQAMPDAMSVIAECTMNVPCKTIVFETSGIHRWDSSLLAFLINLEHAARNNKIYINRVGLPIGVQKLFTLAETVPEKSGTRRVKQKISFIASVGISAETIWGQIIETVSFVGETVQSICRLLCGRARFRQSDLQLFMQQSSVQALPIVSLISLLVGLILAYVGAIQLRLFGAQIYVADLVGIGMVRALAPIMTGIIIAGRTGASFAAQLGTMQVNEEIDALQTFGFHPIDFLVLPRLTALSLMMPLLCLYADLMGILGGLIVAVTVLDLTPMQYMMQTQIAVSLNDLWVGLFSSGVFGILVALAGWLRGIQCGRSAAAVGEATTSAVVLSIVSIIVATAVITILADILLI
jgi:phospholipid/cholesterol/gamma-HCH transport system permease protein